MLDLRQLAALRAVADTGSVSRAAVGLGWSQPTVTHHLRGLARELGAPAVAATPTGTRLTPAGEQLLPHARSVLGRSERALEEVRAFVRDRRRRVVLGIYPSAGLLLLPHLLAWSREQGVRITVREAEVAVLRRDLAELRVDAAVVYTSEADRRPLPPGCERSLLVEEPLSLLVPAGHRLAGTLAGVELEDLADEDWILSAQPDEPIELLLRAAAAACGFRPRARARSDDYLLVAAYVGAGLGISLVPTSIADRTAEGVVGVPVADDALHRSVELIAHAGVDQELVAELTAAARRILRR
ncbi:DNA-binding transcriptional regulator, LysR family [Klenkia marina]|uniref:DNA-binding transcriptional regulator, LysR family n=1 Tax=Klenkia marina TaxID=1960309 RepID=A0A1G4YM25_9ACTN|nr:LysR family transcriptional regulator [Klenkia marina]SCX54405.1 DNA-binding transcriptional regulator, LysR family [Klenkia marina]